MWCKLPQRGPGGAPADKTFSYILEAQDGLIWNFLGHVRGNNGPLAPLNPPMCGSVCVYAACYIFGATWRVALSMYTFSRRLFLAILCKHDVIHKPRNTSCVATPPEKDRATTIGNMHAHEHFARIGRRRQTRRQVDRRR